MALEQIAVLDDLGVPPSAVLVSHVDRNHDRSLHAALATSGAYLIYDGPSRTKYHTPDEVAGLMRTAVDHGAKDRILLGLDLALRSYRTGYGGRPGLGFLHDTFLPVLRRHGFDARQLHAFGNANPARALSLREPATTAHAGAVSTGSNHEH
jgi:phosphotriesterase-related protein